MSGSSCDCVQAAPLSREWHRYSHGWNLLKVTKGCTGTKTIQIANALGALHIFTSKRLGWSLKACKIAASCYQYLQDVALDWFGKGSSLTPLRSAESLAKGNFQTQLSLQSVCDIRHTEKTVLRRKRPVWDHPAGQEKIRRPSEPPCPHHSIGALLLKEEQSGMTQTQHTLPSEELHDYKTASYRAA